LKNTVGAVLKSVDGSEVNIFQNSSLPDSKGPSTQPGIKGSKK